MTASQGKPKTLRINSQGPLNKNNVHGQKYSGNRKLKAIDQNYYHTSNLNESNINHHIVLNNSLENSM